MLKKRWAMITMICAFVINSGCTSQSEQQGTGTVDPDSANKQQLHQMDVTVNDIRIPLVKRQGKSYFALKDMIKSIGYNISWDEGKIEIGDIDVFYLLTEGSNEATKEENQISLSTPLTTIEGTLYAPVSLLGELFDRDIHYSIKNKYVSIHAISNDDLTIEDMETDIHPTMADPYFQDDPNDPFKESDPDQQVWYSKLDDTSIVVSKPLENIDVNALLREARKYMGVPYKFGAKPYSESGKFDCSSYTQYIFGKFNIELNRVSRNQAKQGHSVSRTSLRKGDLVFFSVPGRFKSDKTVGHVGIYIGNGKMINTFSDKKGVHITDVNSGYWSTKYLGARRVVY